MWEIFVKITCINRTQVGPKDLQYRQTSLFKFDLQHFLHICGHNLVAIQSSEHGFCRCIASLVQISSSILTHSLGLVVGTVKIRLYIQY